MITSKNYIIEGNNIKSDSTYLLQETMHEFDFLYIDLQKILPKEYIESWFNFTSKIPTNCIYHDTNTDCNDYGIETKIHISLLYGIEPNEYNLKLIKQYFSRNSRPINIKFTGISFFYKEDKDYEVMKFDIDSESLVQIYNELSTLLGISNKSMSKVDNYNPHATIAYLNKDTFCYSGRPGSKYFFDYQLIFPFKNIEYTVKEIEYQDIYDNTTAIYLE